MRFLLRAAFWLGVVFLALPTLAAMTRGENGAATAVGAADAASAAASTLADMRQFCERQPDACAVGAKIAVAAGQIAQSGAKTLYEFLSESLASSREAASASGARGDRREATASGRPSQHTLTPSDLAPEWRGAARAKDAPRARLSGES